MEIIPEDRLRYIAGMKGFNLIYLEKDYFLTMFLYLVKDIKGIYLKGGTALNKIFLNHTRLSEDLDFAMNRPIPDIKAEIENIIKASKLFTRMETDKSTREFLRYRVYYRSYFQKESFIITDLNRKASILLEPERYKVPNFYGTDFSITTLNIKEIVAEKIRALITRNQPRDYFDAYFILKKYTVDMELVKRKTREAGERFDRERIFKNARKIYSKWDSEIPKLTNRKLSFRECINLISKKLPGLEVLRPAKKQ